MRVGIGHENHDIAATTHGRRKHREQMIATSAMVMAAGKDHRPAILPGAGSRGTPVPGYSGRAATVRV
jgi:hypothetical protein